VGDEKGRNGIESKSVLFEDGTYITTHAQLFPTSSVTLSDYMQRHLDSSLLIRYPNGKWDWDGVLWFIVFFFLFSLLETFNVDRTILPRPENGRLMRGCLEIGAECEWDYIAKYVAVI
jgi:hypothetical protein